MTSDYEVLALNESQSAVIVLTGQVDRDAATNIAGAYDAAAATSPTTVVLDFSRVDYINSTGIALIVSLLGRARAEGRAVHAAGLTDHYRQIFDITRLSDFIQVYSDVDAAVGSATT
ncbi:MAG TPA: STAS domain-containing protein [Actinomycetes bacterium]|nr:STAS domain-containing protein [Actinomycetes bacterium]